MIKYYLRIPLTHDENEMLGKVLNDDYDYPDIFVAGLYEITKRIKRGKAHDKETSGSVKEGVCN